MGLIQGTEFYISKRVGKAITDYEMLADGDRIAVAVSGGKDSLTLLRVLNDRRKFVPIRKALFEAANKFGCTKVALGHHKDDIIETILLNMFFQGEISAMSPRQELFKGKIVIIRPLAYVDEDMIRKF